MSVSSPVSPRENRRANELAQRREDALAAASAVFAAKGYHDAQMTEIAAAAELSRASLYSMFTGKEELYQQVISSGAEAVREPGADDSGVAEVQHPQVLQPLEVVQPRVGDRRAVKV